MVSEPLADSPFFLRQMLLWKNVRQFPNLVVPLRDTTWEVPDIFDYVQVHTGKFRLHKAAKSSAPSAELSQACLLTFSMSSIDSSIIGLVGTYPYHTFAALFSGFILFRQLNKGRDGNPNGLPLPPGPKGYPLIGNLFDMPADKPWVVYDEWRKTYGKFCTNSLSSHTLFNSRTF